jgi:23S rRNA (pseudouridine1915-N3)-methyltransferase
MKISIYYFGKKNDLGAIQAEYEKRLSSFCDISIIQIKPSSLKDNSSITEVMKQEAYSIIGKWPDGYTIVLDRSGKEMSTEIFMELVSSHKNQGNNLNFIIGGAYGVDPSVLQKAQLIMSLSSLTMTHEFAKVLTLEQIYRAFTIITGKKYHY